MGLGPFTGDYDVWNEVHQIVRKSRTQRGATRFKSEFRVATILVVSEPNRFHIEFNSPRRQHYLCTTIATVNINLLLRPVSPLMICHWSV
jgi:hypothetical protein